MKHHVRWMIAADWPEVMAIDSARNPDPWPETEMRRQLRKRNIIGMVSRHPDCFVSGFMIYELMPTWIGLHRIAVHPEHSREGVGSTMIEKLIGKLTSEKRNQIRLYVRESNLDSQLFFRAMGFSAVSIDREHYEDTKEDAYSMVRGITKDVPSRLTH